MNDPDPLHQIRDALKALPADADAAESLLPLVYEDLRRMARARLGPAAERATLQPTALVHEAWLKLVEKGDPGWDGRRHFVGAAARAMRRILVDDARRRQARKPEPHARRVELDDQTPEERPSGPTPEEVLDVDALLTRLEESDPRKAEIVHLRFFAGLTQPEIAEMLGVSLGTVERDWRFARALLAHRLEGS